MILDTSAVIAILRGEGDAVELSRTIEYAAVRRMSAANFVEAAIITDSNRNPLLSGSFDNLIRKAAVTIEPVTAEQAEIAREAYRDFGKGRHRAGLNFGDCFAYALAKVTGEPLLFKGDDFRHTDLEPALEA
jgi:ribonuclease VapC